MLKVDRDEKTKAQLMLTNPRDSFKGQSISTNIVRQRTELYTEKNYIEPVVELQHNLRGP